VGTGAGLVQLKLRAAGDDLLAVFNVDLQGALEGQHAGLTLHQGQQMHAEGGLQGGIFVELIEHLLGLGAALEFNHNAHAAAV